MTHHGNPSNATNAFQWQSQPQAYYSFPALAGLDAPAASVRKDGRNLHGQLTVA